MAKKTKSKKQSTTSDETPQKTGTVRWGPKSEAEFIKVPKVLIEHFADLDIDPQHLLLILLLQSRRYENRKPRFYWQEIAESLGRDAETVRKWGRVLKQRKLLGIKQHKPTAETSRRPGQRFDRNSFDVAPFVAAVERLAEQVSASKKSKDGDK